MVERVALAFVLIAVGIAGYRLYQWARLRHSAQKGLDLMGYRSGSPAILYFSAPGCGPCLAVQEPALTELSTHSGGRLQIIQIDALEHPGLADAWGVLSVPTTFLIDSTGRPRGVNNGAARAPELREQLAAIGEWPEHEGTSPTAEPAMPTEDKLYNQGIQPEANL